MALANWHVIWEEVRSATPNSVWETMGFHRSAESYWHLTRAILGAYERSGGGHVLECDCEEVSMHLRVLLNPA
jgi:hypothetical protein